MIVNGNKLGNIRIKALIYEYDNYEIYRTISNAPLLVVRKDLYDKWIGDNLLYSVNPFKGIKIDDIDFYYLTTNKNFQLSPVRFGDALCDRQKAVTFAFALKQMRKNTNISLYDGIYIEEYGYILPTYTSETISDDALLGTYLSAGRIRHFSDGNLDTLFLDREAYIELAKIVGIEIKEKDNLPEAEQEKTKERFTLAGRPELEKFFNEHIINILNEPERYSRLGIDFPSSVILYGPPGCGKTYAVDKLIDYLGLPKFEINSASIASPYIHDTAKRISGIFESAINAAPSVVVIDEMESYLSNREDSGASGHHFEEVAEFLRQIQAAQNNKVLIIAMTNMYSKIDPAILRRGRFDHHIEVGLPSQDEIFALLLNITKRIVLEEAVDLKLLSEKLNGKSLADVTFIVKEAGLLSGQCGSDFITNESLNKAIEMLPKEEVKRRIGFY